VDLLHLLYFPFIFLLISYFHHLIELFSGSTFDKLVIAYPDVLLFFIERLLLDRRLGRRRLLFGVLKELLL